MNVYKKITEYFSILVPQSTKNLHFRLFIIKFDTILIKNIIPIMCDVKIRYPHNISQYRIQRNNRKPKSLGYKYNFNYEIVKCVCDIMFKRYSIFGQDNI